MKTEAQIGEEPKTLLERIALVPPLFTQFDINKITLWDLVPKDSPGEKDKQG